MRPGLRYRTARDGPQGVPTGRRHRHFDLQDGNSVIMRQCGKRMPQSRGLCVDTLVLDRRRLHAVLPVAPARAPAPRATEPPLRIAPPEGSVGREVLKRNFLSRPHHRPCATPTPCHTKVSTTPSSNGSLGWILVLLARARGPLSLSCFGKPAGIRSQLFRDT